MGYSLRVPLHKISVYVPYVGGGFGGKAGINFEPLVVLLSKKAGYLSGGEKKMLAIARSLATIPRHLLLDEALEGLASIVVERFINTINMIKEQKIGVILTESNVLLATKLAEKVYVIERGEIIFEGSPEELLSNIKVMKILKGA